MEPQLPCRTQRGRAAGVQLEGMHVRRAQGQPGADGLAAGVRAQGQAHARHCAQLHPVAAQLQLPHLRAAGPALPQGLHPRPAQALHLLLRPLLPQGPLEPQHHGDARGGEDGGVAAGQADPAAGAAQRVPLAGAGEGQAQEPLPLLRPPLPPRRLVPLLDPPPHARLPQHRGRAGAAGGEAHGGARASHALHCGALLRVRQL
mmetsp:Transcript_3386/g.11916  ORF Transcript_3386/g.11916 Transcript_3386/m.11916 type:complete len:203 (+) Transcript_3386:1562-2170(+)